MPGPRWFSAAMKNPEARAALESIVRPRKRDMWLAMTDEELKALAEDLAGGHAECEDCWYSCPLSTDGCCNDTKSKDVCTCGRDTRVARIYEALARVAAR